MFSGVLSSVFQSLEITSFVRVGWTSEKQTSATNLNHQRQVIRYALQILIERVSSHKTLG